MESGKEETVIVLDFLQNGYPFDKRPSHRKTPIIQAIGNSTSLPRMSRPFGRCGDIDRYSKRPVPIIGPFLDRR